MVDTNTFERLYPSFSLALALAAAGLTPEELAAQNGFLRAGKLTVPLNETNQTLIDFWGPGRTFPTFSYVDVLEGRAAPDTFRNKIVLVGIYTPTQVEDLYENPFTRGNLILAGGLPAPGVEIHASAIKTYLTGRYFHRAPRPVNLAFLVLVWTVTVFAARQKSPWLGLLFTFLCALACLALVYSLWLKAHYWLNAAAPLVMLTATYVGATVENIVRAELERRRTKAIFSRYISAPVADELLRRPEKIELGGVKQKITILFSDIRGFTAFSEGKPPEEVVARLNEYFTAMTEVVFRHSGTLGKYLGDGLIDLFGAPVPYPDHARRAVAAAADMLARPEELNRRWAEKGEVTLGIGIGINSGPVVVGNIGSPERMDYTVIGEAVNLASRLEGMNKEYKTQIIISEHTARLLNENDLPAPWALQDLGEARVRDLVEPVKIYTFAPKENK